MKPLALGVTALVCGLASSALATTVLVTTPAFTTEGDPIPVTCAVINAGPKNVVLELDVMKTDGTVGLTSGPEQLLGAGVFMQLVGSGDEAWCQITVKKGSAKGVHGTAFFSDGGVGYKFALPAQ
ncbi:MAG TPA: hypothetical protein VMR50_10510 [Myxococcota bacterium]|nr:hypothetical protein [Myxococcota bacterium]